MLVGEPSVKLSAPREQKQKLRVLHLKLFCYIYDNLNNEREIF